MPVSTKIAHIVGAHGWGGMEARTIETALWQAERGHEVMIVAAEGSAILEDAQRRGLKRFALDFDAPDKLAKLRALRQGLRRHGATVADFHTNRCFAVGVQDLCALVRSRHNLSKGPPQLRLPKTFPFDRIIVTSEAERSHLVSCRTVAASNITVVGEWAEERFFAPLSSRGAVAARRASLGLPDGDLVLGACAMLRPDNDFGSLIRATAQLRQRGLPVSCLIVGGPPEHAGAVGEAALRGLAADLGVAESVRFLGHRTDVPDLLDVMDVAAVVSRHTAQTRVGPEAAARGRPVVGFSVGALTETVSHGRTGLLAPLDDIDAFTAAAERLLRDRRLRETMGSAAARHAEFNFRQEAKMEQTLAAYRQADARRGLPVSALGVHPLSIVQAG